MRPRSDGTLPPHHAHCLGCGDENPASMGLRLSADGERVRGSVRFDRRQEGAPGFAHGGAVATVLDDALGSVLVLIERAAVTGRLDLDFRAPAFLDRDLLVEAWCERIDGRKLHLAGVLTDEDATIAEARALFVEVDLAHFRRGGRDLPENWFDFDADHRDGSTR